jgi:predicted permease
MNDLKFAFRQLLKNPGFTAVAVLTLALGIGMNTSMFTALRSLTNRALPYPEPETLVQVFRASPSSPRQPHHSVPDFLDFQESGAFEYVAAANDRPFSLAEPGQPAERVPGLQVSASFFPLLGLQPALGRVFTEDEDRPGQNNVAILDYGFWQRRFAGDSNIIGRVLRLDSESVTVVGVMPARFRDRMLMGPVSLWRPIAFTGRQRQERTHYFLKCIARLKRDMSLHQAQASADVLARQIHREDDPEGSVETVRLVPLAKATLPPQASTIVWSIMGLAGFVLLIACANLANLQFARTASRTRELAIRGAMGAPRGRVLRQLLSENLLIALIGGALGVLLAVWCNTMLRRQFVFDGEMVLNLRLNGPVLMFALLAASASGLGFGLVPAWLASRTDVNTALKQSPRGATSDRSRHRIQYSLIITEVALALVLLAGASLVIAGLREFSAMESGWQVDGITTGHLTLSQAKYDNDSKLRAFADRLQARLDALPGVKSAALCWNLPIRQFNVTSSFTIEGRPEPARGEVQNCFVNGVTPDYFNTLGMRLLAGRNFTRLDTTNRPPVVVINEAMARAFWPEGSPLGARIDGAEIVGVVPNVRFPGNPAASATPYQTYRPFAQEPRGFMSAAIRGDISAETLRRAVADVDPDQPVGQPGPARAEVGSTLEKWAVAGKLLSSFALLGLSLAALGVYGVISGFVARCTGEIGVRMALGAQIASVLWLVVGKGLSLSLIGTAIGLIGALGLARLLASVLPGLPPPDAWVLLAVAACLVVTTLIACWVPARRAAKVDPMVALRTE